MSSRFKSIVTLILSIGLMSQPALAQGFWDSIFGGSDTKPESSQSAKQVQTPLSPFVKQIAIEKISRESELAKIEVESTDIPTPLTAPELFNTLPSIDEFAVPVHPGVAAIREGQVIVEIFSSTEKATASSPGSLGVDSWLNEMAETFNREAGLSGKISVRRIDSGTAYQYILRNQKDPESILEYQVDAFSPSNSLWVRMAESQGVQITEINPALLNNLAGVVVRKDALQKLGYSEFNFGLEQLVEQVLAGKIRMGYTNPFASSTGINFLAHLVQYLERKTGETYRSQQVVELFKRFQQGVPITYETTLQMRDGVLKGDTLDAMVMEYQTYLQLDAQSLDATAFLPFGELHTNPLVAIGDIAPEKLAVLKEFNQWILNDPRAKGLADRYGFNKELPHSPGTVIPGADLVAMQRLWKQEKAGGDLTVAIFLADISGSMEGERNRNLRKALVEGAEFISPTSHVGLVAFDSRVFNLVPVAPFEEQQKAAFLAYSSQLPTVGGTAMYDGIAFSADQIISYIQSVEQSGVRPVLIVLTDGESNSDQLVSKSSSRRNTHINDIMSVVNQVQLPTYILALDLQDKGIIEELNNAARQTGGDVFRVNTETVVGRIVQLLNSQL